MNKGYIIFCLVFIIILLMPNMVVSQSIDSLTAIDLKLMSFEELMKVEIKSSSLTNIKKIETPSIVTTITSKQIETTPYRNLLDLMEVYVPGMTFVNHWNGSRIGVQGVMADQNTAYLLLVNGENVNMQSENGPLFEIQNRDLTDIEKIEIISGPGSVIYGPGAIGGVISITTKDANTSDKAHIGVKNNFTYNYFAVNGNYTIKKKNFSAYFYGSYSGSQGITNPEFYYIDRANGYGYGFMGPNWGNKNRGTSAPNFYGDFDNKPQMKFQLGINFLEEFSFFARYTSFSFIKQQQKTSPENGSAFPGLYGQQFVSELKNKHKFSNKFCLTSNIGFHSLSYGEIQLYQGDNKPFDDITQMDDSFSENKFVAKTILNYENGKKLKVAVGMEGNYWYYGPEWGKSANTMIINFAPPVRFAVKDTTSGFYKQYNDMGIVTVIGNTIDAWQISGFFEVNYKFFEKTTVLLSSRFDKHNMAELANSPRIAVIQELNSNNYLKFNAQQSVRIPAFRELYAFDYAYGRNSAPEKLIRAEIIYSRIQNDNFTVNASTFFQTIDHISWINDSLGSSVIGTFNTCGIEADFNWKINDFSVIFNYSYIHQLSWDPSYPFDAWLSNIGLDSLNYTLEGAGENRINNFPKHQAKFVVSYNLKNRLYVHLDGRFASSYGQLDMLDMFNDIHNQYGTTQTKEEMDDIYNDVMSYGYSRPSFTSNLSIQYSLPVKKSNVVLTANFMNLIAINHIRYVYQYWEEGDNRQYPRQVGFIDEPISFSLDLKVVI